MESAQEKEAEEPVGVVHCDDCQAHIPKEQYVILCRSCADGSVDCDEPVVPGPGEGQAVFRKIGFHLGRQIRWMAERAVTALVLYVSVKALFGDLTAESPFGALSYWHCVLVAVAAAVLLGKLPPGLGLPRELLAVMSRVQRKDDAGEDEVEVTAAWSKRVGALVKTTTVNTDLVPWMIVVGVLYVLRLMV